MKLLLSQNLFLGLLLIQGQGGLFESAGKKANQAAFQEARVYFPKAEVIRCGPSGVVLQIETHVGNVSRQFVGETMSAFLQKTRPQLDHWSSLWLGGIVFLIVGFDDYNAVYKNNSPTFSIMDSNESRDWYRRQFPEGYKCNRALP